MFGPAAGTLLAALCVACLSLPAQAALAPDDGGIGIQLVDAPAPARADPRAHRYIVDHLAPGSAIQRRVRVVNSSARWQHVELYPGAATVEGGQFTFGGGRAANDLTRWITLDALQLDLPPGADALATVTIKVPADAPPGEQYAVIWAAMAAGGSQDAVRQVHRVGVRVYLDVGAGGAPAADFTIGTVTAARDLQGRPWVGAEVANTGGRALDLTGAASLSDGPAGLRAGPFPVSEGTTLAPRQSGEVTILMPAGLPAGPWTTEIELRSGTVQRTASRRVTFPEAGERIESKTVAAQWPLVAIPSSVGLLLAAGAFVLARRLRTRRAARQAVSHG